jgi:hypothetical protein
MQKRYNRGSLVHIARDNDNELYEVYHGVPLRVTHVAIRYMPAKDYYQHGMPEGNHPGFDSASRCALYDLEELDGKPVPFRLYDYELA